MCISEIVTEQKSKSGYKLILLGLEALVGHHKGQCLGYLQFVSTVRQRELYFQINKDMADLI